MEAFIKKFKSMQVASVGAVSAKPGQDHTRGISKKLQSMVQEHKNSINNLISECEEVLSQLDKYQGKVRDWKTQHHQLQERLYDLMEKNMAAIELLEQEDTSVANMTTEGEAGKKQLQTMLECLDTVNTAQEVVTTIDEGDQYNVEVEVWIQKCQELFPNVNTVSTSVKVQETIKKALDMTREIGATAVPVLLEDSSSAIMEKVERITNEIRPTLKVLLSHSTFVRGRTFGSVRFPPLFRAQSGVMHPPRFRLLLPKTEEAVATVAARAKQEQEEDEEDSDSSDDLNIKMV
ncbi:uncharacterized protein [Cherax quadricarinatus]